MFVSLFVIANHWSCHAY